MPDRNPTEPVQKKLKIIIKRRKGERRHRRETESKGNNVSYSGM